MAPKYEWLTELYRRTQRKVVSSPQIWEAFLRSAGCNYRLPFDEQLLVFAQRPDATAVLEIERWNNRFGRWVNKGATGIAVFDYEHNGRSRLKYYFDVSDTRETSYSRPVPIWTVREEYTPDIIRSLKSRFGVPDTEIDLSSALIRTAKNSVEENLSGYLNELYLFLPEGWDRTDTEVRFRTSLESSVAYILLSRCGIDPGKYVADSDFRYIADFNTPEAINALGVATGDIAKTCLSEISRIVLQLQKSSEITQTERSIRNGENYLQNGGRLPAAESAAAAGDGGTPRDLRIAEKEIPEGESPRDLYESADNGQTERAPDGDRGEGDQAGGNAPETDGGEGGSDRGTESDGYDGVDAADEQSAEFGAGDREDGSDLRLENPGSENGSPSLPSPEEQVQSIIDQASESTSTFAFSQEIIDAVLARGSNFVDGKFRIYEQFEKNLSSTENIAFLKNEYGWGGTCPIITGTGIDEMHDAKGIHLTRQIGTEERRIDLGWKQIEKRIAELIRQDRYLNPKEKELYPDWQQKMQLRRTESAAKRLDRVTEQDQPQLDAQYGYRLGDTVYIGAQEFEILAFDENRVLLHDVQFPLLQQEMSRADFDLKVRENPMNDHLKITDPLPEADPEEDSADEETDRETDEAVTETNSEPETHEISSSQENEESETNTETPIPAWEKPRKERVQTFDLHPEIPMEERHTFDLSAHEIEPVGKKARFHRNLTAITTLKICASENRFATPYEQIFLSGYVGWGGIPEAFDANNPAWADEYAALRDVLTPAEYASARESTLTAFYTPPSVISAIYKVMERMGFREGNILEPSCGIGHFIGMLPQSMQSSRIYGVEIDQISASIAGQLYQKSSIAAQPFEEADVPDSFFDAVVGNVPFGDIRINDRRYNKYNFLIHDYFVAKSLDKLRPGGVLAFVTSKGTMDKENPAVRKYIAQRADLLGAIRLPNDTFKGNAGTEVVSDILFFQKRERLVDIEPDWVHLNTDENGYKMNSYFVDHPEMVLGEWKTVSGRFGDESTVVPYENSDLTAQLEEAILNIHGEISMNQTGEDPTDEDRSIPADPSVRNYSFTEYDDEIYFRENSRMMLIELSATAKDRVRGLIGIRDCVRRLIEYQTENYPDTAIKAEQEQLNTLYDRFVEKFGLINSRTNVSVFSQDSSYSLLSALEILDENGKLERKADMFSKRTIKPHTPVTSVDTAAEAFALSMGEKACVDMEYMMELTGKTEAQICADLKGVIFRNPLYMDGKTAEQKYLPADEYLSGDVRDKLAIAEHFAEVSPDDYSFNVEALEKVQPTDLSASEISVQLGSTWLPPETVEQFVHEFLSTPTYLRRYVRVSYLSYTSEWTVEGKTQDLVNVKANSTYGTNRINAYQIIEDTLNLKDVQIYDYIEDQSGRRRAVLNQKDTQIAQAKQEIIKQGFKDWIWTDPARREELCQLYNDRFNSVRPREYDGSPIRFDGMNPEIVLRTHQRNAIARILYGGNTLLAHAVGAGKTYEMVAAAMEMKRLGLCQKSLFVVPNHLTEQWASEFMQLYPAANILVATRKDFEAKNRKRFCGRIATGDYDAVIIGHSQFEKIPISIERQRAVLEQQIREITEGIAEMATQKQSRLSIKQMERTKKSVQLKLEKLNDQSRKDDVVTFEELGIDRLFVDESHYFKNLYLFTKMRNVGGIAQTEAQKSSDLYMKCRYLDQITGGRGIIFATGTPISNSMVEMYTIQRYLQYNMLKKNGLQNFDSWAATFGETISTVELKPEGTGYRSKTRFAKFNNIPELMSMFKEVADIQTLDMLNLPVPKANYHTVAVKPSEHQKKMVASLSDRAERVRSGRANSNVDNMLLITNDGRKLALDQRLVNGMLPDFEGSKVNACVENIYRIWAETKESRSAQLLFCDLSTPRDDGTFSVYNDIRGKLIARGIPAEEIRFIHEADTEVKKLELFRKTRRGDVRILMGSTQKMGAGTNVQNKLIAMHDLDCPWRPSDLEQRSGRIIRQGNENPEVEIYRYVTEDTFDAYSWQLVENKQKFASQIMTGKSPVRSAEDIDETVLSFAEIKMLATGNPYIKEKMDLDIQVQKLRLLKSNYLSEKYKLEDRILKYYPQEIARKTAIIDGLNTDIRRVADHPKAKDQEFIGIEIKGTFYGDKTLAGEAILAACGEMTSPTPVAIGEYRGFEFGLSFDSSERVYEAYLKGKLSYLITLGNSASGNILRLDNALEGLPKRLDEITEDLENTMKQLETAKQEVAKPFDKEDELTAKSERLAELNSLLNVDKRENEIVSGEPDESAMEDRSVAVENKTIKQGGMKL